MKQTIVCVDYEEYDTIDNWSQDQLTSKHIQIWRDRKRGQFTYLIDSDSYTNPGGTNR